MSGQPVKARLVPCVTCGYAPAFVDGVMAGEAPGGWTLVADEAGGLPLATPHKADCLALPQPALLDEYARERRTLEDWLTGD